MKTLFILIILLSAIFGGCGLLVDNNDWIVEKMHTQEAEIPQGAGLGEPVAFIVKSSFNNSCWEFNRFGIAQSGFDVMVTPYMKMPNKSTVCFDVMVGVSEEGHFTPVLPGEYRFHFWRADNHTLDYTVTVR